MLAGQKVVVVMPAYNAALTLERTYRDVPPDVVDEVLVVDDASHDDTVAVARGLKLPCFLHERNLGYGGNQKTCYREALKLGADIVVMVHPDYQYSPKIIPALAGLVASGEYDLAIGSRILGGGARRGGMPFYKYLANRLLTAIQNLLVGAKLSEYHTGFRAFSRRVLTTLPLRENSDDFVFDNEMLAQAIFFGFRVGEVSCPTRYFPEASSINFPRSVRYGLGVLITTAKFVLEKLGLARFRIFSPHRPPAGGDLKMGAGRQTLILVPKASPEMGFGFRVLEFPFQPGSQAPVLKVFRRVRLTHHCRGSSAGSS